MTRKTTPGPSPDRPARPRPRPAPKAAASAHEGERIAKVLSRAGAASRREAERMIELGEVAVNGTVITSPALNVKSGDKITVRGEALAAAEPARLWLYYKPEGLVTSTADEKGRATVFENLPEDMPRVMSVGRLDLNSEGLLLLTNDGALKRRLELPSTGWLRKYRVRVNGTPTDPDLAPLRKGIEVEGERFQPMEVHLDRVQGANAWLTVGLREGKNREIRRAMSAIGLTVNRLIRVSYGPFRLGEMKPGAVEEVRTKVLRDQLGLTGEMADDPATPARSRKPAAKPAARPAAQAAARAATPATAGKPASGRQAKTPPRSEALATLSQAWKTATRPKAGADADAGDGPKPRTVTRTRRNPAGGKAEGKPPASPSRKPATAAKPAGKPAPKSAPKAAPRGRNASPEKPATRSTTGRAKPGTPPRRPRG